MIYKIQYLIPAPARSLFLKNTRTHTRAHTHTYSHAHPVSLLTYKCSRQHVLPCTGLVRVNVRASFAYTKTTISVIIDLLMMTLTSKLLEVIDIGSVSVQQYRSPPLYMCCRCLYIRLRGAADVGQAQNADSRTPVHRPLSSAEGPRT